jgi:hypothetical protein
MKKVAINKAYTFKLLKNVKCVANKSSYFSYFYIAVLQANARENNTYFLRCLFGVIKFKLYFICTKLKQRSVLYVIWHRTLLENKEMHIQGDSWVVFITVVNDDSSLCNQTISYQQRFCCKELRCNGYATFKKNGSVTERPVTYTYFRLTSSSSTSAIHNRAARCLAADGAIFEEIL